MTGEKFIALRFMFKGTERGTFSPLTLFAWVAIAVGVAAMSCLLSVMYGFEASLKDRFLNAYPHVMVRPQNELQTVRDYGPWTKRLTEVDGVARVVPYIETERILQSELSTVGGVVLGIPLEEMRDKFKKLDEGNLPNLSSERPEIILGSQLAERLGAYIGGEIKIISPIETGGMMGMVPNAQSFVVSGIYSSGHYDFDYEYLMMPLSDAQGLLKKGDVITGWQVWGEDESLAEALEDEMTNFLPQGLKAESWGKFNSALFQSLKLEQYAMFSVLSFAIVIAVMNIGITLTMYVSQKKRHIGILRALGASQEQIRKIFVWQGAFLGGMGLFLGAVITTAVLLFIRYSPNLQLPAIYYDRSIPIEVRPLPIILIYAIAILLIMASTLFPARKAMQVDPIEAIRQ